MIYRIIEKIKCVLCIVVIGIVAITCGCSADIKNYSKPKSVSNRDQNSRINKSKGLRHKAENAWLQGDMGQAQALYLAVTEDASISNSERAFALEHFIRASIALEDYPEALKGLHRWKIFDPKITKQMNWQNLWGITTLKMGYPGGIKRAVATWENASLPIPLRGVAGGVLMITQPYSVKEGYAKGLSRLYTKADHVNCMMLEQRLFSLLSHCSKEEFAMLESLGSPEKDYMYPWSIISLEALRREGSGRTEKAIDLLGKINHPGVFADATLLASVLCPSKMSKHDSHQKSSFYAGCYALILPMNGGYAPIAWKIVKGANIAQDELAKQGVTIDIRLINTESKDWLAKLESLPSKCVVVGGPIQAHIYATLKAKKLLSNRIFFTFLPNLEGLDEGVHAWRFFPSQEDQISTVLKFSRDIQLHNYGVLYPEDGYGFRMKDLFINMAQKEGISTTLVNYNPKNTAEWNKAISSFVETRMVAKVPIPTSSFQALFLPDVWKNIEILMPYLFFQGEDRLVLVGTSLWEQGLSNFDKNIVRNMELAVFPGAWDKDRQSPATRELKKYVEIEEQEEADFWYALGYDFIRFASTLNIKTTNWDVVEINRKIKQSQQGIDWSMAPIVWEQGKAKQQLFLLSPTLNGIKVVDVPSFKKRRKAIQVRHNKRVNAAEKEEAKNK